MPRTNPTPGATRVKESDQVELPSGDWFEVCVWVNRKLVEEMDIHGYEAMNAAAWIANLLFATVDKCRRALPPSSRKTRGKR